MRAPQICDLSRRQFHQRRNLKPKGFSAFLPPHQSPLKIEDFSGAEPARKRFFLWKMRFTKTVPCPPYTPLGAIESSRGLRPSRALRGFSTVWGRSQWERPFSVYAAEERRDSVSLKARRAGCGSGGAVGRADGHLLPRILSSGYALFKSLPQPRRQRRLMISRKILEIRRPWPLQSMAANGRRQNPRQQGAVGTADRLK